MNNLAQAIPFLGRRAPRAALAVLVLLALASPLLAQLLGNTWLRVLNFALLWMLLAIGLNLVVGFAGLLDLGYIAFYAVGAYTWAFLASPHFGLHMPFWVVLPLGAGLAALAGIALGFPTLRLRGDYLAIVTLGFGEIIRIFMNNLTHPINVTNGPQGVNMLDPLVLFGWDLSRPLVLGGLQCSPLLLHYYAFLACVVLAVLIVKRLQVSRIGRAWAAIRDDELAAKAIGIDTRGMKLLAFAMGATFGGVAGGLFGAFQGFVSPESFSLMESIAILTMIVFGGMGNLAGVIVGALALSFLPEVLRHFAPAIQGGLLGMLGMVFDGLAAALPTPAATAVAGARAPVEALLKRATDPEVLRLLLLSLAMILMMLRRPEGLIPAQARYSRPDTVAAPGRPA